MPRISFLLTLALIAALPSLAPGQSLKRIAVFEIGDSTQFGPFALSPDGRYLATVSSGPKNVSIAVWDIADKKKLGTIDVGEEFGPWEVPAVSSAPVRLAIADRGGPGLRIWNFDAASGSFKPDEESVPADSSNRRVAFGADGKRLGMAGEGFALVDVDKRKRLHSFSPRISGWPNAMSPDLRLFAVNDFQDVDLYDTETGKDRGSLLDHCGNVDSLAFRPDGKVLAVGANRSDGRYRKFTAEIKLWDVAKLKQTATTGEFAGFISNVLHPSENVLFVQWTADLNSPGEFKLYDVRAGKWTTAMKLDSRRGNMNAAFSPAGVVAMVRAATIEIWKIVPPE